MDEHHSWCNGSVWYIDWPYQVCVGQWPIFYGPAILLNILKTTWWRNGVLGLMDQCDSKIDLVKYMWVSDLYFMVHWFYLISLSDKLFLHIKKWHRPGVFVPLRALALVPFQSMPCIKESNNTLNTIPLTDFTDQWNFDKKARKKFRVHTRQGNREMSGNFDQYYMLEPCCLPVSWITW